MYILSIDFGTSSVKIAILNENLQIIKREKEIYSYNIKDKNIIEIEPELIVNKTIKAIKNIDNKILNKVDIISYDVFSPSLMCLNKEGNPLYPCIFYLDKRSRSQSRKIINEFGKDNYLNKTGVLPFSGGVTLTSLLWLKENRPEIFKETYKFGHFNTYINYLLTNKWAIDPVNASMTGMYETTIWGGWSNDICKQFNIDLDKLPPIKEAGKIMGGLEKTFADLTGLKQGTPVLLGSNDAATAILGADNYNEGDILNIAGSNEICTILTEKPIVNENYYLRNSLYKNKWQIFSINIGGFAIEWFRKQFYNEMEQNYFYKEYLDFLTKTKLNNFYKNSTEIFKPYLAGDRHSIEKRRGSFNGLTLNTERDDMLMAILVGIHEPILNSIKWTTNFLDLNDEIVVTGGLAESSYFKVKSKILSSFNLKFVKRTTTLGNGKLALRALK